MSLYKAQEHPHDMVGWKTRTYLLYFGAEQQIMGSFGSGGATHPCSEVLTNQPSTGSCPEPPWCQQPSLPGPLPTGRDNAPAGGSRGPDLKLFHSAAIKPTE